MLDKKILIIFVVLISSAIFYYFSAGILFFDEISEDELYKMNPKGIDARIVREFDDKNNTSQEMNQLYSQKEKKEYEYISKGTNNLREYKERSKEIFGDKEWQAKNMRLHLNIYKKQFRKLNRRNKCDLLSSLVTSWRAVFDKKKSDFKGMDELKEKVEETLKGELKYIQTNCTNPKRFHRMIGNIGIYLDFLQKKHRIDILEKFIRLRNQALNAIDNDLGDENDEEGKSERLRKRYTNQIQLAKKTITRIKE